MIPSTLRQTLDTFRRDDEQSFTLLGRRTVFEPKEDHATHLRIVTDALYASLHCRVQRSSPGLNGLANLVGARDFADRLSTANQGTGPWQGGWKLLGSGFDGRLVLDRLGVRFWSSPEGVLLNPDGTLSVRMPNEYFDMNPGFYFALGDIDLRQESNQLVRIYWHLTSSGAARIIEAATTLLNRNEIAFQLKVLGDPLAYRRCDAGVIYLLRRDYQRSVPILRQLFTAVCDHVRPRTSWFAKPIAPGVGLAEDPGDGGSFGEHRARLLAAILLEEPKNIAETNNERAARRLAQAGYTLDALYLNPGSDNSYPVLHAIS